MLSREANQRAASVFESSYLLEYGGLCCNNEWICESHCFNTMIYISLILHVHFRSVTVSSIQTPGGLRWGGTPLCIAPSNSYFNHRGWRRQQSNCIDCVSFHTVMTRWGYIFFNMCIIIPNANAQKLLTPSLLSSWQYAWFAISDHNGETWQL